MRDMMRITVMHAVGSEQWAVAGKLLRNMIVVETSSDRYGLERIKAVSAGREPEKATVKTECFSFEKLTSLLRKETRLLSSDCPRAVASFALLLPGRIELVAMLKALAKHLALNVNCNWQDAAGDIDYFVMRRSLPVKYIDHCKIFLNNVTSIDKKPAPRISDTAFAFVEEYEDDIQQMLDNALNDPDRCRYKYFATQTYRRKYSLKVRDPAYDLEHEKKNEGVPFELPEHVCLRQAIQNGNRTITEVRTTLRL